MRWFETTDRCAAARQPHNLNAPAERCPAHAEVDFGKAESECERAVVGELLATCGIGDLPDGIDPSDRDAARVAMETYGDVYAALHRHVAVDVAASALPRRS